MIPADPQSAVAAVSARALPSIRALHGDVDANGELVDLVPRDLDVALVERLRRAIGSGHAASVDVEEQLDLTLRLLRWAGAGS